MTFIESHRLLKKVEEKERFKRHNSIVGFEPINRRPSKIYNPNIGLQKFPIFVENFRFLSKTFDF